MSNEYSIDDILSEVKKRREENEERIKKEYEENNLVYPGESNVSGAKPAKESGSPGNNIPQKEEIPSPAEDKENDVVIDNLRTFAEEDRAENNSLPLPDKKEDTAIIEKIDEEDDFSETGAVSFSKGAEKLISNPDEENEDDDSPETDMVDILAIADRFSAPEPEVQEAAEEKVKFYKTKKGKILISVICVLLALIIGAGGFGIYYVNNMLDKVTDGGKKKQEISYFEDMDKLQEDFQLIYEDNAYDIESYKDGLKKWYKNGEPCSSTHVLNVLLIGEDTRDEKISDASRADSAIIVSVNIDTGKIHLTSVLRDTYVYFEHDGKEYYEKINGAASIGGMDTYIDTIERYYKMKINQYAVVNFASFPKIIDSLGGVDINITSAEIYEINNHQSRYGGVTINQEFDGTEGVMKLNGTQALAYCRIRKIDSDMARADRQKKVINELFKKAKSSGAIDAVKVVNELASYVYTGYSKKDLVKIGNTALKKGWLSYEMVSSNVPKDENRAGGTKFYAVSPNNWIFVADIPKDAQTLQTEIYGKSNIVLNDNRADYISLARNGY